MSERFWGNLQARYDLEIEKDHLADRLDKEVLINNLHFYIERDIEDIGVIDLLDIQQRLNCIPQRKIEWKYAVEAMREYIQQR